MLLPSGFNVVQIIPTQAVIELQSPYLYPVGVLTYDNFFIFVTTEPGLVLVNLVI